MAAIDERIRQTLETVRSSGIGLRGWRYDGDVATARLLQRPIQRIAKQKAMPLYGWLATSAEAIEHASPRWLRRFDV
jgi:hypothetical protein